MGNSIFLAKIMGPLFMIVAAGFLINKGYYQKITEGFLDNASMQYVGAFVALIVGFLIVLSHNAWEASWVVTITLIGWIGIVKGTWLFLFPNTLKGFVDAYQKKATLMTIHLCLTFIFGAFLTFKGYFS